MGAPGASPGLRQELLRRKPVRSHDGQHAAGEHGEHLPRTIGTFQLAMFGVGATIGTGIFFVLSAAVPEAGPAVIVSFLMAGIAAGLAAICYAEMASSVPVSGSTYSYAYATLGEIVAMGVAACLLLEYGVSTAAVAVGWSGYLNVALAQHHRVRAAARASSPRRGTPIRAGQPAGGGPGRAVHAPADPGRERVGQDQRDHGRDQARRARDVHRHRAHGLRRRQLRRTSRPFGVAGVGHRRGHDLLLLHRSRRRVHRGRRGEGPAEDDAARAPGGALHRHHLLRAGGRGGRRHAALAGVRGPVRGGSRKILEIVTGTPIWGTILAARRRHLDLLGDPGDAVRPDAHPVRDGPRRHAAAPVRAASARAPRRR